MRALKTASYTSAISRQAIRPQIMLPANKVTSSRDIPVGLKDFDLSQRAENGIELKWLSHFPNATSVIIRSQGTLPHCQQITPGHFRKILALLSAKTPGIETFRLFKQTTTLADFAQRITLAGEHMLYLSFEEPQEEDRVFYKLDDNTFYLVIVPYKEDPFLSAFHEKCDILVPGKRFKVMAGAPFRCVEIMPPIDIIELAKDMICG